MAKHPIFGHTISDYPMAHFNHPLSLHGPVLKVNGVIEKYEGIVEDSQGAKHQHMLVTINEVVAIHGAAPSIVGTQVFVATRFGDSMGLKNPIPDLQAGNPIVLQGEYIDVNHAYPSPGNPGDAVLHFTHHPVGFIEYEGKTYQ